MAVKAIQIQVFSANGEVRYIDHQPGEPVTVQSGERYLISVDGQPLPQDAELVREGSNLEIWIDDETVVELDGWCELSESSVVLLSPDAHAAALGADQLPDVVELAVESGDCAIVAQGTSVGSLAAVAGGGLSVWQIAGAVGAIGLAGAAIGGSSGGGDDERALALTAEEGGLDSTATAGQLFPTKSPTISGKTEAGASVTVELSTGETISTIADENGNWSVQPIDLPADGVYEFTAIAQDQNGNRSAPITGSFELDTTAPDAPAVALDAASDTGLPGDNISNDPTPTLSGSGANPGDTVTVTTPTGETLTAKVGNDGSWSVASTVELADGEHAFSVTMTDRAGNTSAPTSLLAIIETVAPEAPSATLASGSDSGTSGDSLTNDPTPAIAGTGAVAGDTIAVTTPKGEVLTATVAADGSWSVTPTVALDDGLNTFSVTSTDPAGNESEPTQFALTINTSAPAAPAVSLAAGSDSGAGGDQVTSDKTPEIGGANATPGDTITVTTPRGEVLTATVAADGSWSVAPTLALDEGSNTITVTATDPAGNVSDDVGVEIVIDTVAPATPLATVATASDGGTPGDGRTNDATPTIGGTDATPGDSITVTTPKGEVLSATVAQDGSWSVTPTLALDEGSNSLAVVATDPAGNESAAGSLVVQIDTTAPAAPMASLAGSSDSGASGDNTTSDTTPTIVGSGATAGDIISVTTPMGEVLTATVAGDGSWSVTPAVALNDGDNSLSVTATDPAGNVSAATALVLVIDTTAADAPSASLAPASDSGASGDGTTSDTTPTIIGSGASAGDTITVTTPKGEVLTATVAGDGTWTATPTVAFDEGSNSVSVATTDPAGNESAATALAVVVDTLAPAAPQAGLALTSDSGATGDNTTSDTTPTIAGSGGTAGDTISVTTPKGEVLTATVAGDGTWSVTPTVALDEGNGNFSVTASDPAGNVSAVTTVALVVDTTASAAPAAALAASSDSGATGDNTTTNTTPEITGAGAMAGDIITVTTPKGEVLTATVASNGTWSVTTTVALDEGSNDFSVTATDPSGNVSADTTLNLVIDNTAPVAPAVVLAASSDTGTTGDNTTNDTTPTIAGTGATAGDTVTVTTPKGEVLTATVAGDGSWSTTPTVAFDEGSNNVSVTATDPAGNVSAATTLALIIDTAAPTAPPATLATTSDSGSTGDNTTNDTTPTIAGTGATAGDTITVTTPKGEVLTATVAGDGSWSATPTVAFDEGSNSVSVTATDPVGNVSAATTLALVIDTAAPAAPPATLAVASDSGATGDNTTSDTTPAINGAGATAGDVITVTTPKGEVLTATVAGDGSWSVSPTIAFDEGSNSVSVTATDPAGNVSAATTLALVIDTAAPTAPPATLAAASDSGTTGDNTTNDTTPTIAGTGATAGDTITVTTPKGEVLTATVAGDGSWSATPTVAFDEGSNNVSVTATDPAGNVSAATTLALIIDTAAPTDPPATLATASDSGTTGDNTTSDTTPTINGTGATAGDVITVTTPKGEVLTATVAGDGSWSVTPTIAFDEGSNNVSVTATDPVGNTSAATTLALVIDTAAPTAPSATLAVASDSGTAGDNVTTDTTPSLAGTGATAGDTITVTTPKGEVLTATVAGDGSWSVTPTVAFDEGSNNVSVTATDPAGNVSAATTLALVIDNAAPAAPPATLAAASDTGAAGDGTTNDTTPAIAGTGATAGDTITVTTPKGEVLTATVAGDGSWSVTPTVAFDEGSNNVSVTATDPAGNVSAATTVALVIDTAAPTAPPATLATASDSGTTGDNTTNDTTPTINGTGATAGDTITVTTPKGEVLTATVAGDGSWSATPTVAFDEGSNNVSVTATDPAGNVSAATTLALVIDTAAPAAPPAVLAAASDSGATGDNTTSDTTPTISGTGATAGDTITVTTPKGEVLTATVAGDGSWSATPTIAFDEGSNNVAVTATDPTGNVSAATTVALVIDTAAPTAPPATLAAASDSGTTGDNTTNDTTPTIAGTGATAGDTITVTTPKGEVLTATVAGDGSWSATPTGAFDEGSNNVSVTATDPAGNVSAATTLALVIDTAAPTAPPATLAAASDSGTTGDNTTNDTTPTIAGTGATAGDTITVTTPKGEVLTATVAGDGSWSATPTVAFDEGSNNVSVTATDPAGNVSAATTLALIIDTAAPTAPPATLATASDSGTTGDNTTSDTTPTIAGTGATAGDTITVTTPKGEVLTATVAGDGSWSATPTVAFDEGSNSVSVTATDPVGNVSAATTLALVIDTAAPAAPPATLAAASDSGVTGDNKTSDTTPTINGTGATAGDTISVTTPKGEVLTATVAGDGSWSVTPTVALDDGSNAFAVTATDPAGNESAATTLTLTVDTAAPTVTVSAASNDIDWDETTTLTFTLSEPSLDFGSDDISVSGATISAFSGSGSTYTATFTPTGSGAIGVSVDAGQFEDAAGVGNTAGSTTINVDATIDDVDSGVEDVAETGNVLTNDAAGITVESFSVDNVAGTYLAGATAQVNGVGSISIAANGDYTFTPANDWSGTTPAFNYVASGAGHAASTSSLTLTYSSVVDQPVSTAPATVFVNSANTVEMLSTDAQLSQTAIEAILDSAPGWMDSHNPSVGTSYNPAVVDGVDGDIRSFRQSMQAGQSITFNWQFQSDENSGDVSAGYEDIALLYVEAPDASNGSTIMASSDTYLNDIGSTTPNASLWESGTTVYTAAQTGVHQFSFVVFNGGDTLYGARLDVDPWTIPVAPVDLPLVGLSDPDGSEQFASIQVSNIPVGGALNNGTDEGGGTWSLEQSDLSGLQLLLPEGYAGTTTLTVTATSTEQDSGQVSAAVTQTITVEAGAATIASLTATDGVENFAGTAGNDFFFAAGGNDVISGGVGADTLGGDAGNDSVTGGDGSDALFGGAGNDTISGGAAADRIEGGSGSDNLTGGTGQDQFIWKLDDAGTAGSPDADVVTDFEAGAGGDLLVLTDLLEGAEYGNLDAYLHYTLSGSDTLVHISTEGNYTGGYNATQTDLTIELSGVDLVSTGSGLSSNITNTLISNGNMLI